MSIPNESNTIAEAIQDIFQGMAEFDSTSVYINDWTALDESFEEAPWVIITTLGLISSREDSMDCAVNDWTVPCSITIPFFDWNADIQTLVDLRQAVIEEFYTGNNQNLGIDGFFNIVSISDATPSDPIGEIYDGENPTNMPVFLTLDIVIEVRTRE